MGQVKIFLVAYSKKACQNEFRTKIIGPEKKSIEFMLVYIIIESTCLFIFTDI